MELLALADDSGPNLLVRLVELALICLAIAVVACTIRWFLRRRS